MTVHLYAHISNIDQMNERRAICRLTRALQQSHCGRSPDQHYLFIGNIDPAKDAELRAQGKLTQLDGLLLGPNFIAIVEFKNYFDPIEAKKLDGTWYAHTRYSRQRVRGGSKKNPYRQARNARSTLHNYLNSIEPTLFNQNRENSWDALYAFVLFHPTLHPDSKIPPLEKDDYWLRFRSVDDIAELALSAGSHDFKLSLAQMEGLARTAFRAQPWHEMVELLQSEWGYLMVQEPGDATPIRIRVWRHDDFTIGRSTKYGHRFEMHNEKISRAHARISVENDKIRIYDLDSKNGTYVNGERITSKSGRVLSHLDKLQLGDKGSGTSHLWFMKKGSSKRTFSTR